VLDALEDLVRCGYRLALDDFIFSDSVAPLLPYAALVKLDLMTLPGDALEAQVGLLRPYNVELVAERVETQDDFHRCLRLGFHYFQGFFFARPAMVRGRRLRSDHLTALRVLALLDGAHTSMAALEAAISCDVTLSYRLLKAINSVYYGFESRVESLRQALVLLGHDRLRGWVSMTVMSGLSQRPRELSSLALQRAKLCEIIGRTLPAPGAPPSSFFTVGLLSILDALFEMPLPEILASLPLSPEVLGALLDHRGPMGQVLAAVVAYEQCRWDEASCVGVPLGVFADAYFEAVRWTSEIEGGRPSATAA
jgi:EAL and modified HD-GYP domain-containing signal transduction protein